MPARLRSGSGWTDACILNISSRGLLIHSARAGPLGSTVELRRGDYVIVARVMWRDGARSGLLSAERLPVEEILTLSHGLSLQLTANDGKSVDRRQERRHDESRRRGRGLEFWGISVFGAALAVATFSMVQQALSRPMAMIQAALGG
jgi:hypothetical protein